MVETQTTISSRYDKVCFYCVQEKLGWAPSISLEEGITKTYNWINAQLDVEREKGVDVEAEYGSSKVVSQDMASKDQSQIDEK